MGGCPCWRNTEKVRLCEPVDNLGHEWAAVDCRHRAHLRRDLVFRFHRLNDGWGRQDRLPGRARRFPLLNRAEKGLCGDVVRRAHQQRSVRKITRGDLEPPAAFIGMSAVELRYPSAPLVIDPLAIDGVGKGVDDCPRRRVVKCAHWTFISQWQCLGSWIQGAAP